MSCLKQKRGEIRHTELHAFKHTGVGTGTVGVEHLDGDQLDLLGDTEGLAANSASDVAAVAVLVVRLEKSVSARASLVGRDTHRIVNEVGPKDSAALKLRMREPDASVDDVRSDALATAVIKDVAPAASRGMADAGQTRGRIALEGLSIEADILILLDVADLLALKNLVDQHIIGLQGHGTPAIDLEGLDGGRQEFAGVRATLAQVALGDGLDDHRLVGFDFLIGEGVVVDDDVAVRHRVAHVRVRNRDTQVRLTRRRRLDTGRLRGGSRRHAESG